MSDLFSPTPPPATVARFFSGQSEGDEHARLSAYFAEHPQDEQLSRALHQEFQTSAAEWTGEDVTRAIAAWKTRTLQEPSQADPATVPSHKGSRSVKRFKFQYAWLAGGIAMFAMILVIAIPSVRQRIIGHEIHTYATHRLEHTAITLPDGSRAQLAPQTKLRYTVQPSGARHMVLNGQAYFTIQHDATRPFIVQTGTVRTQVLGTAFDVQYYPTDSAVRIAVTEGKVASRGNRDAIVLSRGDVAYVTDSTANVTTSTDVQTLTAWTQGRLVFRKVPITDVLAALTRWYGYEFRVDSALRAQRVTMAVRIDDPATSLGALKEVLEATMTTMGDTIVIQRQIPAAKSGVPVPRGVRDSFDPMLEVGK